MRTSTWAKTTVLTCVIALTAAACGGSGSAKRADNPYQLIKPGVILAATSGAQPPFTMNKEGSRPTGFIIDLTEDAASRLGLKVEYKLTPTASGIQGLSAKQYDMVANGLGVTEERKNAIDFAKGTPRRRNR